MLKRIAIFAATLLVCATPGYAVPNERVEADADVLAAEFQEGDIITAKKFNHMIKILKLLRERVSRLEEKLDAHIEATKPTVSGTSIMSPADIQSTPLIYIYRSAP